MARWRKLGIIAGGGGLPVQVAASCAGLDEPFHVIRLRNLSDPVLARYPGEDCAIGEAGKILRVLAQAECDAVVFVGVVKRPSFGDLKADWRGVALRPKIVSAASRGDASIIDVLVKTVEDEGIRVVGVEEVVGELTAPRGAIGNRKPSVQNIADIQKAAKIVRLLGAFDVGQGAVVSNGHVLAIEAAEGTDAMLERCALLPNSLSKGGVLLKRPKPNQDLRVDLPVVGTETIHRAIHAELAGIAIEAGNALILDKAKVIAQANQAGLFVYGFEPSEVGE